MSFDFDSLPPAKRDTFDFDSLPKAAEPAKAETPYSELSTWDLLKAGDVKGLLGRSGNYNTYQEVPAETETGEDYSGTDYEQPDNYLATETPSTQNNLMRDIEAWGSELADKLGKVGEAYMNVDVASSFPNGTYNPSPQTAEGMEGLREAEWEAYETASRPAGMAAVTPFLPAPVRAAAGAVYLPKFASDIANSYSDNLNGTGEGGTGEEQGVLGAALDTAKQTIVDPLTGLASTLVNDPRGLAERIQEHPAALWDEVLAPASILEIPARVGKAGYERYKGIETALNDTLTDTFDSLPKAPEEAGTGSYAGERIASHRLDTGRGAIDDYVAEAAEEFGVPAERIHQIIAQESSYDPNAVSEAGAQGLMQLMPGTAAEMGVESVFDPRENIRGGVGYYRRMLDMFDGDERKALAAYNAGPGNWEAGLGYADEVMGRSVEGTRTGAREVDLSDVPMQDIEDAGLANTNNTLKYHFRNLFDWARQEFGKDVEVSGGWRSEQHNAEVNGSPTSHHLRGNAIDVNLEMLTEAERERFFQKAREMGFNKGGDDMWHDRGSGLHAHLVYEDEGIPGTPTRSASTPRPRQGERYAEPEQTSGEIKDMFGRYEEEPSNVAYGAESEQLQKLNGYIEQLEKRRQEVVDAETSMAEKVRQVQDIERELDNAMEYRARMQEEMLSRMENVQNAASMETDMFGGRRYNGTAPDTYGNTIFDNTRRAERQRIERERNEAMASDYMRRMGSIEDYDAGIVGNRGGRRYTGTAPDTTLESMREGWKRDKQRGVEQFNTNIDSLQKELREQVEAEVQRMIDNPGGKGVQTGLNFSGGIDEMGKGHGDVTGRWTVSNNPQWYQDFHKEHGRPPRKGEYEQIAHDNRMKEQEFAEQDRALRRMKAYRDEFEKNPMGNLQEMMDEVDSRIQYDIAGDGVRNVKRDIKNDVEASFDKAAEEQGLPIIRTRLGDGKVKGHYEGGTITNQEYFGRMRDLFGTLRIGRIGKEGASGFFNRDTNVARTNYWGNYDTMWHEIGHRIDDYAGLSKNASGRTLQEFKEAMIRKYGEDIPYSEKQIPSEGIAEFIKDYVQNPKQAARDFPEVSRRFEEYLQGDKDLAARIKEAQDMARVYREQPLGAKIAATQVDDVPQTTREKISEVAADVEENWVDDKVGIKRAEKQIENIIGRKLKDDESAYLYARIAKDRGVSAAELLLTGKDGEAVKKALNQLYGGVVKHAVTMRDVTDLLAEVDNESGKFIKDMGLKDAEHALATYLNAMREMEIHDLKSTERREYKTPRPYEEYKAFTDAAPAKLKEAAEIVYKIDDNVIAIANYRGLISDKVLETLRTKHKHYVPLRRVFEDDAAMEAGFGMKDKFINAGDPIKYLDDEGGVRDTRNPLKTMQENVFRMMSLAERNMVAQKFTDLANLRGVGGIVNKVDGKSSARDSVFYVWRKGEKEYFETTPEIYRSLESLKPGSSDMLLKYFEELPARWLRSGAVIYNTAFLAKNVLRDQQTAYLQSRYGYKPLYDMARGIFHMMKKDDLYYEFESSGVMQSTLINANKNYVADFLKDAQKTGFRKAIHMLNPILNMEKLSNAVEKSTRMGLYVNARQQGASILQATMEAKEGTIDFSKAGKQGRKVNRRVPFFNAAIQSPVLFYERFKENPARMAQRLAPLVLGSIALQALIRSDDETSKEYDQMKPYEKNMFWQIPVPKSVCETGWVRIPKDFSTGMLFCSLPERLVDYAMEKDRDGKGMKEWAKGFRDSLLPGALSTTIVTALEWQSGYSFFLQRDIVPEREKNLRPEDQYGPDTPELAKWLGKKTGLSPRKLDNLGRGLFAGTYTQSMNVIDSAFGDKKYKDPLTQAFSTDPWKSPQSIQDYYDRKKDVTEAYNSNKQKGTPASDEDLRDYKRIQKIDKRMKKYNKAMRNAQENKDDETYKMLRREVAEMLDREMGKFDKR